MADHSVNELVKLINYHTELLEEQAQHFGMINALTEVALSSSFFDQPRLTGYHYLLAISELLEKAAGINEASIALLRQGLKPYR